MATVSTSTWDKRVSKRPTMLELINSPVKMYTARVTFGATEDYTAQGHEQSLKADGKIKEYFAVIPTYNSKGVGIQYDIATEKIRVFRTDVAVAIPDITITGSEISGTSDVTKSITATVTETHEANGNSDVTRALVIDFLVIGV